MFKFLSFGICICFQLLFGQILENIFGTSLIIITQYCCNVALSVALEGVL